MDRKKYSLEAQLDKLQKQTFNFFWHESNPRKGLVADRTEPDFPAGIAATGFALTSYIAAIERGYISRMLAAERTLATLRFIHCSRHGPEPEATGYNGFYYRFIDINKGRRAKLSELSVLGTAVFIAGALTAAAYFDGDNENEARIRDLANDLYRRVNWQWALGNAKTLRYGWKPESGFFENVFSGYDEAFIVYILALGSPTFPLTESDFNAWRSSYRWENRYGYEYLYAGPLYIHQLPHVWFDLSEITDQYMKNKKIDYFENSVRATRIQQLYAIDNPYRFEGYGKNFWGVSLSDGPGPASILIRGKERNFYGYMARGVPDGPDDGTISPWVTIASLPFAPDIVFAAIDLMFNETDINLPASYGFRSAYNPTYPHKPYNPYGWRSPWNFATNQGPSLAMIENYRTGLFWKLCRKNSYFIHGLQNAGFSGGWLDKVVIPDKEHVQLAR